jgi:hypothetical protein
MVYGSNGALLASGDGYLYQSSTTNAGLGTQTFDASAANTLAIKNGTSPAAHTDDQIYIYSTDSGDKRRLSL